MSNGNTATPVVMPSALNTACWAVETDTIIDDEQSMCYRALFCDISRLFPDYAIADLQYLLRRRAKEGLVFYLEGLPELGKAFETSIITGEPLVVPRRWKIAKGTGLPVFLHQLFKELFEDDGTPVFRDHRRTSGWSDKKVKACQFIRQVTLMWSKVRDTNPQPALTDANQKAYAAFVERMTAKNTVDFSRELTRDALREARRLLGVVFQYDNETREELVAFNKRPWGRHGTGAVAGGESPHEKWSFKKWPGLPDYLFVWAGSNAVNSVFVPEQPASKVVAVPKDFRGPRIICEEPKENQFAQQGLWDILRRHIHACNLTKRAINFNSTTQSRRLCYSESYATIDLKDASDNLSLALCRVLLPDGMFVLLTRYRTRKMTVKEIQKDLASTYLSHCFATMGSALCFPIQTLVFWALSLGTLIAVRDSWPRRSWKGLNLNLRVYGDDIIVPLWGADAVCQVLEDCGLVVNRNKTCLFTPVRESCGEWVFMGKPCPIYRFKTTSVQNDADWIAWRDQIDDLSDQVNLPGLTNFIVEKLYTRFESWKQRYNRNLQRFEVLAPQFIRKGPSAELLDYAGLYAWYVGNDRIPYLNGTREKVIKRWQDTSIVRGKCLKWPPSRPNPMLSVEQQGYLDETNPWKD